MNAITWDNGNQIRLYIKFKTYAGTELYREYTYSLGTWQPSKTLPGWTLDRVKWTQASAVVWTHPDANGVHIRIYNGRCHVSDGCRPYVHEIGFDSGLGWNDGANLPA